MQTAVIAWQNFSSPIAVGGFFTLFMVELVALRYFGDRASGHLFHLSQTSRLHKFIIYPLLAPGVAMHETSHALAALAAGVKVKKFVPFWPQQEGEGWRFGYVQPGPTTPWQSALISLAPLWFTPLIIYALGLLIIPEAREYTGALAVFQAAGEHLAHPLTLLWVFLFVSVSLSNFPSDQDFRVIKPLVPGLILLLVLPFVGAIVSPEQAPVLLLPFTFFAAVLAPSVAACLLLWIDLSRRGR